MPVGRSPTFAQSTRLAIAALASIACCGCALVGDRQPPGILGRLHCTMESRMAAFIAACQSEHEPVVAPHPRFHPVPTRPVFAPEPKPFPVKLLDVPPDEPPEPLPEPTPAADEAPKPPDEPPSDLEAPPAPQAEPQEKTAGYWRAR